MSIKQSAFATDSILVTITMKWISPYPSEGEKSNIENYAHLWTQKQGGLDPIILIPLITTFQLFLFHLPLIWDGLENIH